VVASDVLRNRSGMTPFGTVTTTQPPLTTASGGVAPYVSYAWVYQSGSTAFDILDAAVQNPVWEGVITDGDPAEAVWRVTVTDTVGGTAFTDISVTLIWTQI
jgi:hypothetical protein